ncbi:MAG: hypothetical protein M1813_008856 [Trichoglossum hirsutum]|nr:MAG: hypothetical protein M1813_008856 [Trichoglossum hirsutum]
MSGRGDGKLLRPSSTPTVKIGLSLSTTPPTLSSTSQVPFSVVLTARILQTPHPTSAITLSTHLNPFQELPSRSYTDITLVSSSEETDKTIEIALRSWPHYIHEPHDLRKHWSFITIPPAPDSLTISHEVPLDKILDARVQPGEKYRISLTDKALGTRWWAFGAVEDDARLGAWEDEEEDNGDREEAEVGGGEEGGLRRRERRDEAGKYVIGERPEDLELIVERGEVEFVVV